MCAQQDGASGKRPAIDLAAITSPIIFKGGPAAAYRDPAAIYHEGVFRLYFTFTATSTGTRPPARAATCDDGPRPASSRPETAT